MKKEHSRLGIASLALGCTPAVCVLGYLLVNHCDPTDQFGLMRACQISAFPPLVGLGLGIAGTVQNTKRRLLAIIGLVLNTLWCVAGIAMVAYGLFSLAEMYL